MALPHPFSLALLAISLQHTLAQTATPSTNPTPTTSIVQATHVETGYTAVASASGVPNGGASSSASWSGGLIAVIVIVAVVAILGITSIVLFIVAKRRQWNVRASIKRASRRLTGRGGAKDVELLERRKRSGVVAAGGTTRGGARQKREVRVEVADEEKGSVGSEQVGNARKGGWIGKLRGNNWS